MPERVYIDKNGKYYKTGPNGRPADTAVDMLRPVGSVELLAVLPPAASAVDYPDMLDMVKQYKATGVVPPPPTPAIEIMLRVLEGDAEHATQFPAPAPQESEPPAHEGRHHGRK